MLKRLFRSRILQTMLAILLAGYMRLIKAHTNWDVRGLDVVEPLWKSDEGVIAALWHGRFMMALSGWPMDKQMPGFLISRSRDGAFIAKATDRLGAKVIRGSARNQKKTKDKGGSVALRHMIRHVHKGGVMAITPDGPIGPFMRASMGAIKLAQLTGAPILCLGIATRRRKVFSTWDHFNLPLPFGRGVIVWKGPIHVPANAQDALLEEKRVQMENLLKEATKEADIACGHTPFEATS